MMKFNFEIKDKSFVTEQEFDELEWLRFKDGYIWPAFQNYKGFVVLCKDEYQDIIGWSFIFKYPKEKLNTFFIYIKKDYRRFGIGSKMYKLAKVINDENEFEVSKWSNTACKFYQSVGR